MEIVSAPSSTDVYSWLFIIASSSACFFETGSLDRNDHSLRDVFPASATSHRSLTSSWIISCVCLFGGECLFPNFLELCFILETMFVGETPVTFELLSITTLIFLKIDSVIDDVCKKHLQKSVDEDKGKIELLNFTFRSTLDLVYRTLYSVE